MIFLRQSTNTGVLIGPFVDSAATALTGLTVSQGDVLLSKNAAAAAQKNSAGDATHSTNGWYLVSLNTTDTATLGSLRLIGVDASALPVWHEYMVVTANIYDTMFSTDRLTVDLEEIGTGVITGSAFSAGAVNAAALGITLSTYLDAAISSRASASAFTSTRAGYLDRLNSYVDSSLSTIAANVLTRASASAYTSTRAAYLDAINSYVDASLSTIDTNIDTVLSTMALGIATNASLDNVEFPMVDETDHRSPKTGVTVIGYRSIDGGAFASLSAAVSEVGNGIYVVDLRPADTNGGIITYRFTGTGADDYYLTLRTNG
jgi:hypothetical protein